MTKAKLQGTEKQIAWAEDIRERYINSCKIDVEFLSPLFKLTIEEKDRICETDERFSQFTNSWVDVWRHEFQEQGLKMRATREALKEKMISEFEKMVEEEADAKFWIEHR